ncbi:MAG: transcriptional regulator, GntR family, partial [Mycobacterium sp.]|nr:transcriptional regulator, GntR family [Mycobacterium sp.]
MSSGLGRVRVACDLVELAAHRLRDAILRGALKPGEKIIEEQLCADFGI